MDNVNAVMKGQKKRPTHNTAATLVGLALTWGGTALLISPRLSFLRDAERPRLMWVGIALYWGLAVAVLAIVLLWERQPLQSLWFPKPYLHSVAWGLLLVVLIDIVFVPIGQWVRRSAGLPGFSAGMEQIMKFPFWYRIVAVAGGGVIEELLFRGFTVTRLIALTRRTWLAALLTLAGFSLLHLRMWGPGYVVGLLVSEAAAMAFFIWRRDLLAMIAFHTVTDAIGILLLPAFSTWWKDPALF